MAAQRSQRAKRNPRQDALYYCSLGEDKAGFDIRYIDSFKGRGVFSSRPFQKGDFLLEYRGQLISKKEQENRLKVYHDALKVFMFDFQFNGKLLCIDAAREDGSLGRLINDDEVSPNSKMTITRVDGEPHLCLFAIKDIAPGEEITYNYGDSEWPWRIKKSKEKPSPSAEENPSTSRSSPDDTPQKSKDKPSPSVEENPSTSRSSPDDTPQKSKDKPSPSVEENPSTSRSSPDDTPQDCDHDLIADEMSHLEKCVICGGPFSPLKWSGVRCEVCNQTWHKRCYNIHTVDISEPQSLVLNEQSSSEVGSSEEEYVPDSASDSDSSFDNRSEILSINRKRVQISEVSTSQSASKKRRFHQEDSVEGDRLRSSEAAGSLSEDELRKRRFEKSDATSNEGNAHNECMIDSSNARPEDLSKSSLSLRNRNYCYICGKLQTKFTRHLKTHEKKYADVAQVLSLPKKSKKRLEMLAKLRNKGNHDHNSEVLASGIGTLKPKRTSKKNYKEKDYIHCIYCQALYLRRDLWRHVRKCSSKPGKANSEGYDRRVLSLASMNESALCQQVSPGVWKLLAVMKDDDITSTVRSDFSILQLAQSLFNKHGQDPTKFDYIRQRLRECGRLLLVLRKEFSINTFEDAVRPGNFDVVIKAVKKVSGYDGEKNCYSTPSLALKLGHSLQKLNDILHCRALMAQDSTLIKSTQSFKTLYSTKWSEFISHTALSTLNERHFNKPSTLPFTEDVQCLHRHLEKITDQALKDFEEHSSPKSYSELCKVTMAKVILFNRRRGGEVSKMTLCGFQERDSSALHKDIAFGLTKFERHLCQHFSRVELRGKRGRKVAVLLSPDMVNAITRLTEKRADCGVLAENPFLFARPKCLTPYRGQDCLRLYAAECGAKNPELLRSTQLRKHVATLSQILNLKNHELDQVANFLGHDIRVHREYYRLPEATTQLAKISKLLIAMEKGSLKNLQGKSLEEIEIEDDLELTESSGESDSDAEGDTAVEEANAVVEEANAAVEEANAAVEEANAAVEEGEVVEENLSNPEAAQSKNKDEDKELKALKWKRRKPDGKKQKKQSAAEKEEKRMRQTKRPWSKEEVNAVMRHFKDHIMKGKLASMIECGQCKKAEHPVLDNRTLQNIRDFVRNRGVTMKNKK
ncbi:uncharacterized protein LOC112141094 isoform X9 [Oryzias melastigma]|uniref:uncharacterized protein LOC112141094 isoform X9 n=1 Tax=Oryzias melastigma TaxID=30732 RepID=UPI000CF81767|nr:uncharacterized protein LOC112141094 isoform X9 [Oryzias melastigma]